MTQSHLIETTIPLPKVTLPATLSIAKPARSVIIFAHGSGSSRRSPRNRQVADYLNGRGHSTVLFDLLSAEEETQERWTRHLRFDIELLARRLTAVLDWTLELPEMEDMPVGLFGASTGAAAALVAASERPEYVGAIVSRGGRPDLVSSKRLARVEAPTLLIVGGQDVAVRRLNTEVLHALPTGNARVEIVPGASHLFEEPGKMAEVAEIGEAWFRRHLE